MLKNHHTETVLQSFIVHIKKSKAIENNAYLLWNDRQLTTKEAEIFLANYFARTINTIARVFDVVAALLRNPINIIKNPTYVKALMYNLENFQDELGNGKDKKPHPILMAEWINILLTKMSSSNVPIEDNYHKFVTQETIEFCNIQKDLYSDPSLHIVLGTSFAQELIADTMLQKLFDGYVKNYQSLFDHAEEFERTTPYFKAHLSGVEAKHLNFAYQNILKICSNEDELNQAIYGYKKFKTITKNFWNGIYNQILQL